jgi:DNA-binding Lrp family transcriptional regulator
MGLGRLPFLSRLRGVSVHGLTWVTSGATGRQVPIDETDRRIMALLRADGRCSYRRIGGETGLSESAARHRVTRMVNNGVFKITIVTDPVSMGRLAVRVQLRVAGRPPALVARDSARLAESDLVALVTGERGVIVDLTCDDHGHLMRVLEQLHMVEGVRDLDVTVLLEITKNVVPWQHANVHPSAARRR